MILLLLLLPTAAAAAAAAAADDDDDDDHDDDDERISTFLWHFPPSNLLTNKLNGKCQLALIVQSRSNITAIPVYTNCQGVVDSYRWK